MARTVDLAQYTVGDMNGWFLRRMATSKPSAVQHKSRCERTQRSSNTSPLGSFSSFAAISAKVSFADFHEIGSERDVKVGVM